MTDSLSNDERLRRIEAVTDAALSGLDASTLLDVLLNRVVDLLNADTAAILLLDVHAHQLVATAAKGLDEEIHEGLRLPVGRGFAGRVAQTRRPVIIDDVTAADVLSPVLLQKGLRSLLGVPMFADGDVVGVLHIGSLRRRRFSDDDVRLLQLVADRAASAGRIRADKIEHSAAAALQRSLLPTRLSEVNGIDLAARYVPGHEFGVGGDWYDVFTLPSGWLGVVIGDVSGHGLSSAVVMGRIRSALRAYALVRDDPGQVLALLDRKITHFEAGSLTTALYALISPDRGTVQLSSAGHLRPVMAVPGQPASLPDMPVDPPLGVGRLRHARRTTTLEFPRGAVLVCYTDGLVENRGDLIDTGISRLLRAVEADSAESVCATVMTELGVEKPTDDVAVLVIRHQPGDVDLEQPPNRPTGR